MSGHWIRSLAIRKLTLAVGMLVVWATAEPAWAQRGRGFGRLFGVSRAQLASHPDVQTELKMNDEQKKRVAEVNDQLRVQRFELLGTAFERWSAIQGRMEQLHSDASQKVNEALDPEQRQRLQQIAIQQNGPRALQDPDVVAELGLSDAQRAKLSEVVAENTKAFEKEFGDADRETRRQRFSDLADRSEQRLLGVLNDQQKTRLEELKGEPFEIDLSQFFRRGRGNQ